MIKKQKPKKSVLLGGQQHQQIFSPGQIIRTPHGAVLPTAAANLPTTLQLSNGQSVQVINSPNC